MRLLVKFSSVSVSERPRLASSLLCQRGEHQEGSLYTKSENRPRGM